MITRHSIRRKSKQIFQKVITLRKQGFSYTEIKNETGVAKTTINNWLNLAGLTLTAEHLQIQIKKRNENHILGTAASQITRQRRKEEDIQNFILTNKKHLSDPFFVAGVILYEAEGSKGNSNGLSNSNFRLILIYIKFLEKYFLIDKNRNITYRLYIHDSRKMDLNRILNFWANKLLINKSVFKISWKHNKVVRNRINLNYVGQMEIRVKGLRRFNSKILAISDIIQNKYTKIGTSI